MELENVHTQKEDVQMLLARTADGTPLSFVANDSDSTSVWQGFGYRSNDRYTHRECHQFKIPADAQNGQEFTCETNGFIFKVVEPRPGIRSKFPNSIFVERVMEVNN